MLTKNEKNIVDYLIKENSKYKTGILFSDFINEYLLARKQTVQIKDNNLIIYIPVKTNNLISNVISLSSDAHQLYEEIIIYVDLLNYLIDNRLIRLYTFEPLKEEYTLGLDTICFGETGYDSEINQLFLSYLNKAIIVKKQLLEFKKNGYRTEKDLQESFLKRTTKLSLVIASVAAIASVVICIIEAIG